MFARTCRLFLYAVVVAKPQAPARLGFQQRGSSHPHAAQRCICISVCVCVCDRIALARVGKQQQITNERTNQQTNKRKTNKHSPTICCSSRNQQLYTSAQRPRGPLRRKTGKQRWNRRQAQRLFGQKRNEQRQTQTTIPADTRTAKVKHVWSSMVKEKQLVVTNRKQRKMNDKKIHVTCFRSRCSSGGSCACK